MCKGIQNLHILYKWEIKIFLNKGQLNPVIIATGYYCGKKQLMIRYALLGKISTLENERK